MGQLAPSIAVLPSEILIQVLAHFPTRQLLALATLSRRFHGLVARLHYSRLVEAASLRDHVLVLECYHPSVKFSTPTLHCDYLGTDGIDVVGQDASLTDLKTLYSRFRPTAHPRTDRQSVWATRRPSTTSGTDTGDVLSHDLFLDSGEPFSQLCTQASIIKVDPDRKLFVSIANITEGVIRVWRKWLCAQSQLSSASSPPATAHTHLASASGKPEAERVDNTSHSVVLWTDVLTENVGIKFRVIEKDVKDSPLLPGPNDEPPVAYTLEYEELLVRTSALLLSLERSLAQQVTHAAVDLDDFLTSGRQRQQYILGTYFDFTTALDSLDAAAAAPTGVAAADPSFAAPLWQICGSLLGRVERELVCGVVKISMARDSLLAGKRKA